MASGDVSVYYLGTYNLSGAVGAALSGAVLCNITAAQKLSGSDVRLVSTGNGSQISAFEVLFV